MNRLTKFMQGGLLVLVAVMPFHAFLSVWLGHIVGHQATIQAWKEALLLILSACGAVVLWREPAARARLRQPWIFAGIALSVLGLLVTAVARPGLVVAAFGIKTDLEFIVAGVLATLVATPAFVKHLTRVILMTAAVVTIYDTAQIFLLPADFLTHFGYGPGTILPYQHIAAGTSALRFPGTLGGPNQLGTYLILPLCLAAAGFMKQRRWWQLGLIATCLISLTYTFSRSAWIGALVAVWLTILTCLSARRRRPLALASGLLLVGALIATPYAVKHTGPLQYFVLHSSLATHSQADLSDSQHATSLQTGASEDIHDPFGHGLGTAGPATFHAGTGNIIENYYLQVGYEAGLVAIILFVLMIGALAFTLLRQASYANAAIPAAAAIIGISLVALVLPAWTDSSTALIVFSFSGAIAGLPMGTNRV